MSRVRLLLITVAAFLLALAAGAGPARAAKDPPRPVPAFVLDGLRFGYLPPGLGGSTDFRYGVDDVAFAARTWESRSGDGRRVDLDVVVLRGPRLRSAAALHDWFVDYEQRPPAEARYRPVTVRGARGWRCADQVFWLVRPGLAVSILLDTRRWHAGELLRLARSARAPA